jgi:hypothetical protein
MKRIINSQVLFALLLIAAAPLAATAQVTTYFTDNFSYGSTTNGPSIRGGDPTTSFTSYDIAASKNTIPGTNGCTITPNDFHLALLAATASGFLEAQALFVTNSLGGTNAIALAEPGDYIDVVVVFTNTAGLLIVPTSTIWLGLYNSGGNAPVAGALAQSGLTTASGSPYATGNCQNWLGYVAQMENGGSASRITTRPMQNGSGTTSANQELCANNVGGGAFVNPTATVIETAPNTPTFTFTAGGTYTMRLIFTVTGPNVMTVSNYLYSGAGTNSAPIFSQGSTNVSGTNFLTSAFDGLAIGALNKASSYDPVMDISSISITGTNTVISGPPTITLQPVPVTVATNGACDFLVNAVGFNVTYQWKRNGTNLIDGGDISGSTSSMLVVSPAGTNDVLSSTNGYYVTVSGSGGFSTNSVTNSLALVPATNLFWKASSGGAWDLNNTVNWQDTNGNPQVFNYGDAVTFGNVGSSGGGTVTLSGQFLGAASVTVSNTLGISYIFAGSGSFAGPGNLIYSGTKNLEIDNANTYSGGTIISNATAKLILKNYNGLGSGPVTLAMAGGQMRVETGGSASSGINGDIVVNDDFTTLFDTAGDFAGVFLGNLSGTAGKTLTLLPNSVWYYGQTVTNSRVRVYGDNTTYNGNLALDPGDSSASPGNPLLIFAPYSGSGSQTYNGVISGTGAFMQKSKNVTYLNGANIYSGGTFLVIGVAPLALGSDSDSTPTYGPIGTGPLLLVPDSNTSVTGSGQLFAYGGSRTIANPIQYPSGTNNVTLVIGGTNNLTFTGAFTLYANDLSYTNTITNRIVQVTNTGVSTISGVIDDGYNDNDNGRGPGTGTNYGFILIGNGTNVTGPLVLTATETYTGPTTVTNGGNLQVNGQLDPASAVTVATNATLSGTGIISGTVAVNAGGALAPGAASIGGTLNLNNGLTLSGNVNVRVNRSGYVSDRANVTGTLTNTGTGSVIVTNLGSTLQVGDSFTLFNKPLTNGAALTVIGGGVAWTNKLAVNGSIVVVSPPDVGVQGAVQSSVALGLNFTNTLTVTNAGPGPAYGIIVTDALPANVTFVSASSGGTTNANARQVVWNISSLPANTVSNLTLGMNAATGGYATNIVSVVSSAVDSNLANNTATNITLVTTVIIPTVSPKIKSFSLVNGNVVISGTNGVTGGTYYLLDSTNMTKPLSQWVSVATNIVSTNGASGAFTFTGTNAVSPNATNQFYILSNTNNH